MRRERRQRTGVLDPRLSKAVTVHALIVASLSVAHSLRARGLRRTLHFAALGTAIPLLGEHLAVNVIKALHHHARPQLGGVPLAITLGWFNVGHGTLAMMESILNVTDPREGKRSRALVLAAAVAETSLDLLLDPAGLDLGLWQWSGDGPYAAEVEGANGKRGIPLLNFVGWIGLTATVALACRRLHSEGDATGPARAGAAGSPEAGRDAALLLLSYYLPAAAWATKRRRRRYLLYSAPFAATLWAALKGRSAAS
jgi:uncharacterized membrane protein